MATDFLYNRWANFEFHPKSLLNMFHTFEIQFFMIQDLSIHFNKDKITTIPSYFRY